MSFFNRNLTAADYRLEAGRKCSKFSSTLAVIYLVYFVIAVGISLVISLPTANGETTTTISSGTNILSVFYTGHIMVGLIIISSKIHNDVKPEVNDLFKGFKNYGGVLGVYILQNLYITLFSCFGGTMTLMYIMSVLDHALTPSSAKETFKRLAHIFIFLSYFLWENFTG